MNTELEEQLSAGMRESVSGLSLAGDIVGRASRRHRRRTATIRMGYALGVAGLAGAVAVGVTVAGGDPRPRPAGPATVAQPPAAVRLAAATSASANISYRVRQVEGDLTYQGAFDPKTKTGYLRVAMDAGVLTELLINGTRYVGTEPPPGGAPRPSGAHERYSLYGQYPGKYDSLSYGTNGSNITNIAATPDPMAFLQTLRDSHATISQNADGSIHYTYSAGKDADNMTTTVGDVTIGADQRVAKVTSTVTWRSTATGSLVTGQYNVTTELSDYGTPVVVARPAPVVPAR
jgi:hypothetical protein